LRSSFLQFKNNERGFAIVRIAVILATTMALLEFGALGASWLFGSNGPDASIYPTTATFKTQQIGFAPIGPQPDRPAIVRLMEAANRLAARTNVPYVFGGGRIGSANQCQECTECVRKNHLAANSTMLRFNTCPACRQCGIDCSGFVNRLFAEAKLKYRFASTAMLTGIKDGFLQEQYGFINMGKDLEVARPGDLILEKGHIVMVVDIDLTLGTVDFIHASRGSKRTPVGGIELKRGMKIETLQKKVVRIMRHRELVLPEDNDVNLGSIKAVWSGMVRLMAQK
jgi:cell wall-associated NlpC family hydrolase